MKVVSAVRFRKLMMTLGFIGLFAATSEADGFKVGFAREDVTPEIGTPMSGYYRCRFAAGVLDPLYARCVAFSDGASRALVYSVDNLHLHESTLTNVKSVIVKRTGIPAESIFFTCTHTHTGASSYVDPKRPGETKLKESRDNLIKANKMMAERCAEAGFNALADLAPAKMFLGKGEAKDISFIRRFMMKNGRPRTNPGVNNPDTVCPIGEPDEQFQLVKFIREGKKAIAIMNFQCHPDTISGSLISADWPGLSCTYFEKAMDNKVDALLINGAQGDTNHIRVKQEPGFIEPLNYEMANHMARVIAGSALSLWSMCTPAETGKVRATIRPVTVRIHKGTPEEVEIAKKYVAYHKNNQLDKIPGCDDMSRTVTIAKAYRVLEVKDRPDEDTLPVSVVAIGRSLAFGGFPGEPFTAVGTEIKKHSPFKMTIPACCANGSRGYFPTKDAYGEGGYENATSRFAAGTAERLVDGTLAQMAEFYELNK